MEKMKPERINEIVVAFRKVSDGTANRSTTEHYPLSELKAVQAKHHRYPGDRKALWHIELEKRIAELEEEPNIQAEYQRQRRDKWIDRAYGFGAGLALWFITALISKYLLK